MSTAVYRLHDSEGALLYVGVAAHVFARLEWHARHRAWWPEVARADIEWHVDRQHALDAELRAIRTENPRHNVQGRGGPLQCRPTPAPVEPVIPRDTYVRTGGA